MELGTLCTDEDDIDELSEMHGPLCWQGCGNDHGGFKKLMYCKVTSTWSNCGREREKRPWRTNISVKKGKKERKAQLHHRAKGEVRRGLHLQRRQNMGLLGPVPDFCCDTGVWCLEVLLCKEKKKKWTDGGLKTTKHKLNSRKQWWEKTTISKKKTWQQYNRISRRLRAKWLTGTPYDRDKTMKETPENVRIREEAAARCTKVIKRRVLKKQARKARADLLVKCGLMPGRREIKRLRKGNKNCRNIVKRCTLTQMKQETCKKKGSNISKKKGDRHFAEDGRGAEITVDLFEDPQTRQMN